MGVSSKGQALSFPQARGKLFFNSFVQKVLVYLHACTEPRKPHTGLNRLMSFLQIARHTWSSLIAIASKHQSQQLGQEKPLVSWSKLATDILDYGNFFIPD